MIASARALCEALARDGVSIARSSTTTTLVVTPARAVTPELRALLGRFKPEILGAMRRDRSVASGRPLAPCSWCNAEFISGTERFCPWCNVTAYAPMTTPTVADVNASVCTSVPGASVLSVPNVESRDTLGTLGHLGQEIR